MSTIALVLTEHGDWDIALDDDGFIAVNDPLYTAVVISLFTKRADPETRGPNGCWADAFEQEPLGSRLHLLRHAKLSTETLRLAQLYTEECLDWLVTDKVASAVEVTVERVSINAIDIKTLITRRDESVWEHVWRYHLAR